MENEPRFGTRIRALRRHRSMTQVELARRLDISASYLNLIENNRRPLPAPVLIRLAKVFEIDLDSFSADDDPSMRADVMNALGDALFEGFDIVQGEVQDFVQDHPSIARALLTLTAAYQSARDATGAMAERLQHTTELTGVPAGSRVASDEVSDLLQRHDNHFPQIERAAERLRSAARLDDDGMSRGLVDYLGRVHGVTVHIQNEYSGTEPMRHYDPKKKRLVINEVLPPRSRNFQLAHQLGLIEHSDLFDDSARDPVITTDTARAIGRVALANYFAAAVLMPYERFFAAATSERYDIERLGHRFRTSFEQVCHRLTTVGPKGVEGVPFHMVRVDIAGNISKRFSGSGIRIARYSGSCPRWNVYRAFLTPGMIRLQISEMPDGTKYFCLARTIPKTRGGWRAPHAVYAVGLGCKLEKATQLVYADGIKLDDASAAVPVGVTCRVCDRMDCDQRAFPPIQRPLRVNPNARGMSFYAPTEPK